jgi:hypothetical protein
MTMTISYDDVEGITALRLGPTLESGNNWNAYDLSQIGALGDYGMERRLHTCALIIRIEESDYHSAAQSLNRN